MVFTFFEKIDFFYSIYDYYIASCDSHITMSSNKWEDYRAAEKGRYARQERLLEFVKSYEEVSKSPLQSYSEPEQSSNGGSKAHATKPVQAQILSVEDFENLCDDLVVHVPDVPSEEECNWRDDEYIRLKALRDRWKYRQKKSGRATTTTDGRRQRKAPRTFHPLIYKCSARRKRAANTTDKTNAYRKRKQTKDALLAIQ